MRRALPRGAGSLPVVMLLLLGLLLHLLHSQQAVIGQTRSVTGTVQGAIALEAAEAGLAWALAGLNHTPGAVDSVRERLLTWTDDGFGSVLPRHRLAARACSLDTLATLAPASVGASVVAYGGWTCAWAASAESAALPPMTVAVTPEPVDEDLRQPPAWLMQLQPGPLSETEGARRTTLSLRVTGCSQASIACGAPPDALPDVDRLPHARRHLRVTLALLGDLVSPPDAALSAGGAVSLGPDSRVVAGEPGRSGIAIESGGAVDRTPGSHIIGAPGRTPDDAVRSGLTALLDPAPRWWWHFRASAALMGRLPSLHHLRCATSGCSAGDLADALSSGHRALWVEGALNLDRGDWGSLARPLLLIVEGPVRLTGPVRGHGWLVARALDWQAGPTGTPERGLWQGAITTWDEARLNGPLDLVHRPTLLARLRGSVGTWTVLPGSWRDHGP